MAALKDAKAPAAFSVSTEGKANLVYRAIFREMANPRAGTAKTKKRDEVSGGGKKPWKQKGTGRARQGSIRSPQWAHGGVVFGPQPRSYVSSLNKKERRAAMIAALSDKYAQGAISVLDGALADAKTKTIATAIFGSAKAAKAGAKTLIVFAATEATELGVTLHRAAGNLRQIAVTHTGALDVKDVVGYTRLVFTPAAQDALASTFSQESK